MLRNLKTRTNGNLIFPPTYPRKTSAEETKKTSNAKRVLDIDRYNSKDDWLFIAAGNVVISNHMWPLITVCLDHLICFHVVGKEYFFPIIIRAIIKCKQFLKRIVISKKDIEIK